MDLDSLTRVSFVSLAAALLVLERFPGLRRTIAPVQYRWLTNLGLMLLGGVVTSLVFPATIIEVSSALDTGLVRNLPLLLEVILVFLLLDFWRYWEHRVLHEVPLLWRAHLVHHSDTSLDVTTAQRHHPLEAVLTNFLALILVFALGFSALALGFYLLVATLSALYTHANINLPEYMDRPLRRWLVTPAVHAIHHSDYQPQTDSNYGGVLTIWDHLFGTYTDPSEAPVPHFGLHYFRQPQDTALAPVLLQPFEYRAGKHESAYPGITQAITTKSPSVLSAEWRRTLLYGTVGIALVLLALWPAVVDLTHLWSQSDPYQYAWLVMPMFIYVVGWYHRDTILAMTPSAGYAGLPLAVLAAILWVVASVVNIKLGQHVAFVLALQGVALSSLGWRTYRRLFPIMLLLFLMIPCGDILQPLLRGLTVKWIEWFAILTGLPHSIEGYVIHIGEHRYVVIDACSGLTFFTLASFLGYSFGLLLFRSLPKVLALAALGATLGILTNAIRVSLIVGVDWLHGSQMDLSAHQDIQWLVLLGALGLLLLLANKLDHDTWTTIKDDTRTDKRKNSTGRYGPALAGALMLASAGLTQGLANRTNDAGSDFQKNVAIHYPDSHWLETEQAGSQTLSIPFSSYLEVVLIAPDKVTGRLDENGLRPNDKNIWRHADSGHYQDCVKQTCTSFIHKTWKRKGSNDTRHIFYTYYVGTMTTDSKFVFRLARGWSRVKGSLTDNGLIGFKWQGDLPRQLSLGKTFRELRNRSRGRTEDPALDGAFIDSTRDEIVKVTSSGALPEVTPALATFGRY